MKKLINDPASVVQDMLEGLALADDRLVLIAGEDIVVRKDFQSALTAGKVSIISGGGAGHEPAHAGYVGAGMLTAAVAGPVFTSPSVDAILNAILTTAGPAGVLLIVKNYTGDKLNFGLAAEIARASGVNVEILVVGDDVALDDKSSVGRRGVAGTVLIHKIAGAAADAGLTLSQVKAEAEHAAQGLFTMGIGLSACTVPAAGKPGFSIESDQVEFGLGIHGESGVRREKIQSAKVMISSLIDRIVAQGDLQTGSKVLLMVNNLGGTAVQELDIVAREAMHQCSHHGLSVERAMVGTFLTALEMAGASVTLLKLDDALIDRLEAPTDAYAWKGLTSPSVELKSIIGKTSTAVTTVAGCAWTQVASFKAVISHVMKTLISSEPLLTELDSVVGDGDIGISLSRGASAVLQESDQLAWNHPGQALQQISAILRRTLGGTSGPLYSVFVLRAGLELSKQSSPESVAAWAKAFQAGCEGVTGLGGAGKGDRTMLDAMLPAAAALIASPSGDGARRAAEATAKAARQGAEETKSMLPMKGRSSYIGNRALGHVDPGAQAVSIWIDAVAAAISKH